MMPNGRKCKDTKAKRFRRLSPRMTDMETTKKQIKWLVATGVTKWHDASPMTDARLLAAMGHHVQAA
jgi:hypothetical protein